MRCAERVSDAGGYHFHQCTREAVEDSLCKMHLNAKRKRNATVERKMAEREAGTALKDARALVITRAQEQRRAWAALDAATEADPLRVPDHVALKVGTTTGLLHSAVDALNELEAQT